MLFADTIEGLTEEEIYMTYQDLIESGQNEDLVATTLRYCNCVYGSGENAQYCSGTSCYCPDTDWVALTQYCRAATCSSWRGDYLGVCSRTKCSCLR